MGLDMYLYKRLGDNFDTSEQIGRWRKFNALNGFILRMKGYQIATSFFEKIENDGNQEDIILDSDDIKTILNVLKEAKRIMDSGDRYYIYSDDIGDIAIPLEDRNYTFDSITESAIMETLPPIDGFLWGDTEVDGVYYNAVVKSIEIFEAAKKEKKKEYTIIYYAWW